jgi:threonine dehydratase
VTVGTPPYSAFSGNSAILPVSQAVPGNIVVLVPGKVASDTAADVTIRDATGASATAAVLGPLRERLRGKRVGVIVCGANIDPANYAKYLQRGVDHENR